MEHETGDQLFRLKSENEALQSECKRLAVIIDGRGLCKNCAFLSREDKTYAICLLSISRDGIATHPESLFMAMDYEGYYADLQVKENYGCNQWRESSTTI